MELPRCSAVGLHATLGPEGPEGLPLVVFGLPRGVDSLGEYEAAAGAGLTARSAMLDAAGSFDGSANVVGADSEIPALLLVDLGAKRNIGRDFTLYATVTNITGTASITSWRPMGIRPTPPRQVMLGLNWKP